MKLRWIVLLMTLPLSPFTLAASAPTTTPEQSSIYQLSEPIPLDNEKLEDMSFSELMERAKQEAATVEGAIYDRKVGDYVQRTQDPIINKCLDTVDHPVKNPITAALVVSADGKISKFLVSPNTNLAQCIEAGMKTTATLPKPPSAPYPAFIAWTF